MTKLSRIEYGPLNVVGLNAGEGRVLTPHEVKSDASFSRTWEIIK